MKKNLKLLFLMGLVCLILWPSSHARAQFEKGDKGTLFLIIKQKDNAPVVYEEVTATDKESGEKSTSYTDQKGNVQFQVRLGYPYVIGFQDAPNYATLAIPLNRGNMITSALVYNPPKKKKSMAIDTIWQTKETAGNESNNAEVSIQLANAKKELTEHRKTSLVCKQIHMAYTAYTDANGLAVFHIPANIEYQVDVERQYNIATVNTRLTGQRLTMKKTISYDPGHAPVVSLNTDYILTDTIPQQFTEENHPNAGESLVKIKANSMKGRGVAGVPLRFMCPNIKKVFVAVTDHDGIARFIVPTDKTYWIGVEDLNDIDHVIVPKEDQMIITYSFTYEPTEIVENRVGDTITQQLGNDGHPTTARSFCHIEIKDYSENPLPGEPVYFKETQTGLVYKCFTNSDGYTEVLLPKGRKYSVNFKYENNIDVLDVPKDHKFHKLTAGYTYRGSREIEEYYAKSDRDMNGFFKKFMTSKTTPIDVSDKQFAEKTSQGFNLNMPSGSEVSTPALADGEMITSEGYYSPRFYGFDTKTGHTDWGIALAEGGASNAVYSDGVVIVNTESCTLYAIDSKSGKLLWSHWLSNYLYTTPSIDNGHIYTVYCNGLEHSKGPRSYVLACFDLKTGNIVWQNWLDDNVLGAPVVNKGRVYITTLEGKLSLFAAADGKLVKESSGNYTTNPMVLGKKLYISSKTMDKEMTETVSILDADNLATVKKCTALKTKYTGPALAWNTMLDMNFTGTRMVHYKGKNYNVMGDKLLCTSTEDGKVLWSQPLSSKAGGTTEGTMPVVAGGRIIVGTDEGKIKLYDPATGKLTKEYDAGDRVWTQPMVHDGWIYAGTGKNKLVSIDTHDESLTGWEMWNCNTQHNTVVE